MRVAARRLVVGLIVVLSSGALTFAALEGLCRLLDPLGISYYPETARWLDTMVVKRPVGYWNRPGVRGTYFGAPVHINSLGLRGAEVPVKGPGEFRILVTGDSFPFGLGVADQEALPAALESTLNARAPAGVRYRAVNLGVVSYNTEQELRQLRELGLRLHPDLVTLAFSVNDIEPVFWVFDKRQGIVKDLVQRSYAGSLIVILTRNLKYRLFGFSGVALGEFRADSPRWQAIDRSLTEMNALCRRAGSRFALIYYDDLAEPLALLRGVAAREDFPLLELSQRGHPRYRDRDPKGLTNSAMDSHPNVEGNRMWAELLAEGLRERGLLPALDAAAHRP